MSHITEEIIPLHIKTRRYHSYPSRAWGVASFPKSNTLTDLAISSQYTYFTPGNYVPHSSSSTH